MGAFQRQIGDMVELTPEGEKEIHKYKNNYADATKPLSSKERNWSAWDMGNLWIGMTPKNSTFSPRRLYKHS